MSLLALAASAALLSAAGSLHCAGMCGPFALLARSAPAWHVGKAATYGMLGALAGLVGAGAARAPWLGWVAVAAAVVAVVGAAASIAGIPLPGTSRAARPAAWAAGMVRRAATAEPRSLTTRRFGFGVASGLLPCGLVYGGLGLAMTAGGPLEGAVVMAGFALGTVPALGIVGASSRLLARPGLLRWRRPAAAFFLVCSLAAIAHRAPTAVHEEDCAPGVASG